MSETPAPGPASLLDSPTSNLMRLLDSPLKGFDSADWRRPGNNSTLANTGSTSGQSSPPFTLPLFSSIFSLSKSYPGTTRSWE
jgi:hypothetical protein